MIFRVEVAMQFYFSNNSVNVAWLKYVADFSIVPAMNFSKNNYILTSHEVIVIVFIEYLIPSRYVKLIEEDGC